MAPSFPTRVTFARRRKSIKRLHRAVSGKVKGSKNRRKAANRLAKLYRKVANQRQNTLHPVTSQLAKTKQVVVIEDLNVSGMLKNHHLAQAIADVGFGEFRRQLTYKAMWYGSTVLLASRWEPSSKTCSTPGCGWVDEDLTRQDRVFRCERCGLVIDRDLNAAINLEQLAASLADTQNACGVGGAGPVRKSRVKLPTKRGPRARKKQEPEAGYASA